MDGELRGTCDECGCPCASRVCVECDEAGAPSPCSECGGVECCADGCRAAERDEAGYLAAHPAEAAGVAGPCGGL
jgi:hypothetical protein